MVAHPTGGGSALRKQLMGHIAPGDDVFLLDYAGAPGLLEDVCAVAGRVHLLYDATGTAHSTQGAGQQHR